MALTDRAITALKATGKAQKHFDGGGLHIFVSPSGGKLWRLAYRFHGKAKLLSLGQFPTVTLRMARDRREEAKRLLENGIDPSTHKQELKETAKLERAENTFEAVAREWYKVNRPKWVEKTAQVILSRLRKRHVFPAIGKLPYPQHQGPGTACHRPQSGNSWGAVFCASRNAILRRRVSVRHRHKPGRT